jgi:aspartate aminotransferase
MPSLNISKRAINTPVSPIRKLYPLANQAKKHGINVYHLNIGQPDLETPKVFFQKIKKIKEPYIGYAPSEGILATRQAFEIYFKKSNLPFNKDDLIITTGGSEAIVFSLMAIADHGDEILVFEPLYTNYLTFAQMAGVKLIPITTKIDNGFHLPDEKEIIKKISPKTKGLILCNPNNPTGTVYSQAEIKILVKIAKKYKLFIISDEAYREFVFQGKLASFTKFKEILNQLIIVDSISKRFNLCGARIGYLATKNKDILAAVLKFAQGRLSSPTIEQLGIIPLLKNPKKYTSSLIKEYKKRRDTVIKILKTIPGVKFCIPEGAFYLIVKLPIINAEHFCSWLLTNFNYQKETIMFAPAQGFYQTHGLGKDEIRIAFVLDSKKLQRAMAILKIALEKYKY